MRRTIAVLIALLALPLFAQTSLLDQGKAAMARNDAEAAASLFEKAVAQNLKSAEAHYWLGSAYGSQAEKASIFGQASLAGKTRDEFEKAVELDPNHLDARFGLIQFYAFAPGFMGGSYEKAFAQAAEIRKRDPLRGHRAAAFIYAQQKKTEEAKKEYFDAVSQIVYASRGDDVETTIVNGKILMRDRKVLTLVEATVLAEARKAADLVRKAVAQ